MTALGIWNIVTKNGHFNAVTPTHYFFLLSKLLTEVHGKVNVLTIYHLWGLLRFCYCAVKYPDQDFYNLTYSANLSCGVNITIRTLIMLSGKVR